MNVPTYIDDLRFECSTKTQERSKLFLLQPIGDGTVKQESLLSFLMRTSHAHAVNPRLLIKKVLAQDVPALAGVVTSAAFFQTLVGTANGLGQYAEIFASVMARLTGQSSLRHLTLLPWQDLFSYNGQGLLARHPRWCPVCLYEQNLRGDGTAFPLLWSMEMYLICTTHKVLLEHRCPSCGANQYFIPRHPDLSICCHCGKSLACIRSRQTHPHFQSWVAEAVSDMVARQSAGELTISLERFKEFVHGSVAAQTGGNRAAFCRSLGFNDYAVNGWLNKNQRPSITQFLTLCYGLGTMPTDVFDGFPPVLQASELHLPPGKLKHRKIRPRPMEGQLAEWKKFLASSLASGDGKSVSVIAKELDVGPGCLRYWFTELCKQLSEQSRTIGKLQSQAHRTQQCALVKRVVSR